MWLRILYKNFLVEGQKRLVDKHSKANFGTGFGKNMASKWKSPNRNLHQHHLHLHSLGQSQEGAT
jgi:hypothetical protein